MNIDAFLEAAGTYAFKQWESTHSNFTPEDMDEVIKVIQSSQFKAWQKDNPNGTIDQYYRYLRQVQAYHNSNEYKIEVLQDNVESMGQAVGTLREEVTVLQGEVKELNNLKSQNGLIIGISLFLFLISAILAFSLIKKYKSS